MYHEKNDIEKWNKEKYKEYINFLINNKDDKYKEFHTKLCNTKYEILGINLPKVRNIAKKISKTDYESFLSLVQNKYYEETMIEGLVISQIKDKDKFLKYFPNYIKKIDNWGITDSVCNSLKILKHNKEEYFDYFKNLALKEEEFLSRVGLISILNYYIEEKYLNSIFQVLNNIKSDKYYVNMAQAWLICEMYIKFPDKTKKFILKNKLNKFTHNKAIQKIRESFRISKEEKDYLNSLKK